jgi:hypothetical protein
MEAILTALKDLLKFKITKHIDTGDKTYDSMLNMLFLSLLTWVFTLLSWETLSLYYMIYMMRFSGKRNNNIDSKTYKYYSELCKKNEKLIYLTWNATSVEKVVMDFTNQVCIYFNNKVGWKVGRAKPSVLDVKTLKVATNSYNGRLIDNVREILKKDEEYVPLFMQGREIAGIQSDKNGSICIFGTCQKVIDAMIEEIKKIEVKDIENNSSEVTENRKIYIKSIDQERLLYANRSMEFFVSRYKSMLISLLDKFIETNKTGISGYNGYGTYNLGILVYGRPGTGKTFLMKAVCNYLKRDAYVVDMRKIKTVEKFREIFLNDTMMKKYVYVLDEFDCVQGAIAKRDKNGNTNEAGRKNPIDELKKRHLELLTILSKSKNEGKNDEKNNPINREIEEINKQIEEEKNALNLDTILTVLDGMVEMRGRVIIAATNCPDAIDEALTRAGRIDIQINLDTFNNEEAHELLNNMYKTESTKEELNLLKRTKIVENVYTPTALINLAMRYGSLTKVLEIIRDDKVEVCDVKVENDDTCNVSKVPTLELNTDDGKRLGVSGGVSDTNKVLVTNGLSKRKKKSHK